MSITLIPAFLFAPINVVFFSRGSSRLFAVRIAEDTVPDTLIVALDTEFFEELLTLFGLELFLCTMYPAAR